MIKNICSILLILSILYFCTDSKVKDELFKKYKFLILFAILFLFLTQNNVEGYDNPVCDELQGIIVPGAPGVLTDFLDRAAACSSTENRYTNTLCRQVSDLARDHAVLPSSGARSSFFRSLGTTLSGISGCSITDSDGVSDESCGNYINESIPQDGSEIPEWIQTSCEPLVTPLETQISDLDTLNNQLLSDNTSDSTRIQTLLNQKEALNSEKEQLASEKNELEDQIDDLTDEKNELEGATVHCYGEWSDCTDKCKKTYTVKTEKSNGGKDCKDDAGNIYTKSMSEEDRTVDCHRGEDENCPICKYESLNWMITSDCPLDGDKIAGLDPID